MIDRVCFTWLCLILFSLISHDGAPIASAQEEGDESKEHSLEHSDDEADETRSNASSSCWRFENFPAALFAV